MEMMTTEFLFPALIFGLLLCCAMCVYRIAQGPTAADLVSFVGTLALAKYLVGKRLNE